MGATGTRAQKPRPAIASWGDRGNMLSPIELMIRGSGRRGVRGRACPHAPAAARARVHAMPSMPSTPMHAAVTDAVVSPCPMSNVYEQVTVAHNARGTVAHTGRGRCGAARSLHVRMHMFAGACVLMAPATVRGTWMRGRDRGHSTPKCQHAS